VVKPQAYERRLISLLLRARLSLATIRFERREYEAAIGLLRSVSALSEDPNPQLIHLLGSAHYALGQFESAEPLLRSAAETASRPEWRATDLIYLGRIALKRRNEAEAQRLFQQALSVPGLSDAHRAELQRQLRSP
jgi:tetratricopeptide (TPR) repeat protein